MKALCLLSELINLIICGQGLFQDFARGGGGGGGGVKAPLESPPPPPNNPGGDLACTKHSLCSSLYHIVLLCTRSTLLLPVYPKIRLVTRDLRYCWMPLLQGRRALSKSLGRLTFLRAQCHRPVFQSIHSVSLVVRSAVKV